MSKWLRGVAVVMLVAGTGCAPVDGVEENVETIDPKTGKSDSSVEATLLDFEFESSVIAESYSSYVGSESYIRDQLLFTIGHLNGNRSVGRLDKVVFSNVRTESALGGTRIFYKAKMPVAWGSKTNLPTTYTFTLPSTVGFTANKNFTAKYKVKCVDFAAHDVDEGSIWYYYRPKTSGCALAPADVVVSTARVGVSPSNTTGKYPEYTKVWEDGVLRVVSIFGKYEDGKTTAADAGIAAYNEFVAAVKRELAPYGITSTPAVIPVAPGVGSPDIELVANLPGGRKIQVNALLVDNVSTASSTFYARYERLSTRADLIVYNGHAGLGQNVRALARKGSWVAGQYVIVFMNGCDTYAYVDGSLAETRARINRDDPAGSKYMDFVVNGMPSFFRSNPAATMALLRGLLAVDKPQTYEQIFANIDKSQVVLVTGEHDNVFKPAGSGTAWAGLADAVTLTKGQRKSWITPSLPAGKYVVEMSGTGDADLYVKKGTAPTTTSYDCRPYKSSSNETCLVTLTTATKINIMAIGDSVTAAQIRLTAKVQ